MFHHDNGHPMSPTNPLGTALRALPLADPPKDLFAQITHTLQARRPARRRWLWPTALAASVVLGLLLTRIHSSVPVPETGMAQDSDPAQSALAPTEIELQRLHVYSRSLEQWLAGLPESAPRDGRSLMAAAELEDLVGLVDVQLSAARSASESLPLWRQRVALLEDLAAVRSEPLTLLAEADDAGSPPTIL